MNTYRYVRMEQGVQTIDTTHWINYLMGATTKLIQGSAILWSNIREL